MKFLVEYLGFWCYSLGCVPRTLTKNWCIFFWWRLDGPAPLALGIKILRISDMAVVLKCKNLIALLMIQSWCFGKLEVKSFRFRFCLFLWWGAEVKIFKWGWRLFGEYLECFSGEIKGFKTCMHDRELYYFDKILELAILLEVFMDWKGFFLISCRLEVNERKKWGEGGGGLGRGN